MGIREQIRKPAVGGAIAVVIVVAAVVIALNARTGPEPHKFSRDNVDKVWFYDLNNGELFAQPLNTRPPVKAPSGDKDGKPAGVRAHVFACDGHCGDKDARHIRYLETTAEGGASEETLVDESHRLVRVLDGEEWHSYNSKEGLAVRGNAFKCPNGGRDRPCFPK